MKKLLVFALVIALSGCASVTEIAEAAKKNPEIVRLATSGMFVAKLYNFLGYTGEQAADYISSWRNNTVEALEASGALG